MHGDIFSDRDGPQHTASVYLVMMLSYLITPPKPVFCSRVPLRSSVVPAVN